MQQYKLQVICLDNLIGLTINQQISKQVLPLISYYFWPVSEAWEQISSELESKFWIPEADRVLLLNLIVDIVNDWKQSRTNLSNPLGLDGSLEIKKSFTIVGLS